MKQLKIGVLIAALLGLWGCGEGGIMGGGGEGESKGKGTVQLTLEPGAAIVISSGPSKASSTVDVSSFGVKILDPQAGKEIHNYSSYSDVPPDLSLEAGEYVMTAGNNGVQKGAAFDRPYYAGSTTFSVKVGEVTPVNVLCELKSTGVEVGYTPKMLSELSDIEVIVSVTGGNLPYNTDEKRTGWFPAPENQAMTISVSGTRAGAPISNSQVLSGVMAKQLRHITLDIKTSGSSETIIEIDKTVIIKDVTVSVPDADDAIDNNGDTGSWEEGGDPSTPSNGPTIVGSSFNGSPFNIDNPVMIDKSLDALDVLMSSTATGGIQNLMLEIQSEMLEPLLSGEMFEITGPIDLANPPQGADAPMWVAGFADLGILDPANPIKGKATHLFAVGGLMSILTGLPDVDGTSHSFKLTVTDAKGTVTKTLTVVVAL